MVIKGLQKTTLLDYPGHVAATVFMGGCNFRCPFCHNMNLVTDSKDAYVYTEEEIIGFLRKRAGILDGVCITGGEPTLYKELPEFLRKIKEIDQDIKAQIEVKDTENSDSNYLIKLDTNGTNPEMLKYLITEGLIDYVAMDIKTSIKEYGKVTGLKVLSGNPAYGGLYDKYETEITANVRETIEILKSNVIDYEFRTTVIKEYHNAETMREIAKLIKGAKKYYLQAFTDSEYVPNHSLTPPDKEYLMELLDICRPYVGKAELRGVD